MSDKTTTSAAKKMDFVFSCNRKTHSNTGNATKVWQMNQLETGKPTKSDLFIIWEKFPQSPTESNNYIFQYAVLTIFLTISQNETASKLSVNSPLSLSAQQKPTVKVISFSEQETTHLCFSGKLDAILSFSLPRQKLRVNIWLHRCLPVWK